MLILNSTEKNRLYRFNFKLDKKNIKSENSMKL